MYPFLMSEDELTGDDVEGSKKDARDMRDPREMVRFRVELEFVQCLANPFYVNCMCCRRARRRLLHATDARTGIDLAQTGMLDDERFVGYIRYLRDCWRRPEYARYLTYPSALDMLHLLVSRPSASLKEHAVCDFIHVQQFYWWQHQAMRN